MHSVPFILGLFLVATVSYAGNTASSGAKSTVTKTEEAVVKKDGEKKYKIAIFAPDMSNSQVIWNKRVAEELANAGHDVTMYMMYIYEMKKAKVEIDPRVTVVPVNGSFGFDGEAMLKDLPFEDVPIWNKKYWKMASMFGEMCKACEKFINDQKFMDHVESSKFDLAFTHMYNFCPIGIIHKTKIPTWIWLSSGALIDNMAELMGVPNPPSYVSPMMMDAGDKLTFWERIKSFTGHVVFKIMWKITTADKETAIFRAKFGKDFPDLVDLAAKAPLAMINSNELYDFARPTLAKIVQIGGLGIKNKEAKPLKAEFADRIEKTKGFMVMSFGSIAPMYLMPKHWKESYFYAFTQFPDVQFFLRYENPEEINNVLPQNVYASKWLPQTDLLQHPKALGLISHGGYNSIQDALHAGVPMVATGIFGDQPKNAHLVERLGMGINVHKSTISKEKMTAALKRLIEDKSLKANAQRYKAMIATKPVSAETLLVKWTEFLAQHKNLDQLVPYGTNLSFFTYHSIDVISFFAAIALIAIAIFFSLIRCVLRSCGFCSKQIDVKKKKQ